MRRTFATFLLVAAAAVLGTALGAAPALASKPNVKKVTFTGTPAEPTITLTGLGMGSLPISEAQPAPECFGEALSGDDFGTTVWFEDESQGWTAGQDGDCIGLGFSAYTETEIVLHLGSGYSHYVPLQKGDVYKLAVYSLTKKGKVHFKKPPKA